MKESLRLLFLLLLISVGTLFSTEGFTQDLHSFFSSTHSFAAIAAIPEFRKISERLTDSAPNTPNGILLSRLEQIFTAPSTSAADSKLLQDDRRLLISYASEILKTAGNEFDGSTISFDSQEEVARAVWRRTLRRKYLDELAKVEPSLTALANE